MAVKNKMCNVIHSMKNKFGRRKLNQSNELSIVHEKKVESVDGGKVPVQWKVLSEIDESQEKNLIKITDKNLINSIMYMLPELFHLGVSAGNVAGAISASGQVMYKAVIPAGAKLVTAKNMPNAVKSIFGFRKNSAGNVPLTPVGGVSLAMNIASSTMSIASIIVGQYYFRKIYKDMRVIIDDIEDVKNILNVEYKSKVLSLMTQVQKSTVFEFENLANDEFRRQEIANLRDLESECNQLLFNAEASIDEILQMYPQKYDDYIQKTNQIDSQLQYEQILFNGICRIDELIYAFNLGKMSSDQCYHHKLIHEKKIRRIQEEILSWHRNEWDILKIDIKEGKRQRVGLDGLVHVPLGWFKDEHNYIDIPENVLEQIKSQTISDFLDSNEEISDLFGENIQIIVKDDVIYYLPVQEKDCTETIDSNLK